MRDSITAIQHATGMLDGFLFKRNKATLMHNLSTDIKSCHLLNFKILFIVDGNAMLRALKEIPPTFKENFLKALDQFSNKNHVTFSTDMYFKESPKSHDTK